jgi:hypothetical protein
MNRNVFITVICLASCAQQPKQAPPPAAQAHPPTTNDTLLWIHDKLFDRDTDYVRVSYQLESDTLCNHLLATYIANYRYGGVVHWPQNKLDSVVNRPSFIHMMLLFRAKTPVAAIGYNQAQYYLEDLADALLLPSAQCSRTRFYTIADTLLTQDNFQAVEMLWNKADLKRLPSFEAYVSRIDTNDFTRLADLAAFFHNKGFYARRDSCMTRARELPQWKEQYQRLASLMAKNKPFSHLDYEELLYNDDRY